MSKQTFMPTILLKRLVSVGFWMALVVLIVLLSSDSRGQTSGMNPQDKNINAQTQLEVIDSVSQALNQVYVFPEVAKKMEKYLREQYKNKKYKDITSLDQFTQKLTEDLQEISHDKHLWVGFASDEMLARFRGDTLTDEAKQLELEERRRDNFCFKEV